ncbi:MAG: hypothetical protein M1814_004266 [Vezdaea aestivalis]|nr:MAG: hypothetical protein M1814_004266 [Vezdaea aestivalis]
MTWKRQPKPPPDYHVEKQVKPLLLLPKAATADSSKESPDRRIWYQWWLQKQVENQPRETFCCLPDFDAKTEYKMGDCYFDLWREIWRQVVSEVSININELVMRLSKDNIITPPLDDRTQRLAQDLIFATIGWQTMLYRYDPGSCPPSQVAIVDEMDGHKGLGHMELRQERTNCKRKMQTFLLGFGMLLPPRNSDLFENPEDKKAFKEFKEVDTSTFNAHLLTAIGKLDIVWTDSLACHMEFDQSTDTLYLFRFPSFCATHIRLEKKDSIHRSIIHACSAPYISKTWGTDDDVEQMLLETLLTYRLLFGQGATGRQLFRKLDPFEGVPDEGRDDLLTQLCGQKLCPTDIEVSERKVYKLARDLPIYRSRLVMLLNHLKSRKARSWRELWQDKRDSASWLTFWLVLIIGGTGLILAFFQVVLGVLQIVLK